MHNELRQVAPSGATLVASMHMVASLEAGRLGFATSLAVWMQA